MPPQQLVRTVNCLPSELPHLQNHNPPKEEAGLRMFFNILYQNYVFCFNITITQIKI